MKKPSNDTMKGYFVGPNTLENRTDCWDPTDGKQNVFELSDRERQLVWKTNILLDINDECDILLGPYEEDEIPYEKLDVSIKIVEKGIRRLKDKEKITIYQKLLDALYLAKEKKTLVSLIL